MVDDTYAYNFRECKRVGLKVGSYLFFRPNLSAREQFKLFVSKVDTKSQDLLPLIDAEVIKGVSVRLFQRRLLELCDLLEKEYGKKPIIYTGRNFYNKHIYSNSRLRTYKYFIASYTFEEPVLSGDDDYLMCLPTWASRSWAPPPTAWTPPRTASALRPFWTSATSPAPRPAPSSPPRRPCRRPTLPIVFSFLNIFSEKTNKHSK